MEELGENDPTRIGPYELLGTLGFGGMGRVYLGQDADGGRVAVKVIHADLAREPEFRRRFQREIAALRTVSGPGIAAILDADAEAQRPWLATEYVDGPSLHRVVHESGTLDAAAVRALGARLARTLAAIHAAQLVHRDLKPTNLLLPQDGPKLIDFGIARDLQASSITRTGLAVGTPQFMAPEQLESRLGTGTAADVFALAGLLVFASCGRGPFGEGTPAQLLYAVVHSEPDLSEVPQELRPLLLRCLNKDPEKRPTAARVAEEWERAPGVVDPEATVRIDGGSRGPRGGLRGRRSAVVGAAALAAVVVATVVLVEGNAAGSNTGGHSAKGVSSPPGAGQTSTSDSAGGSADATSPAGGGPGGGPGTASGSAPGSVAKAGSPSGQLPVGTNAASTAGTTGGSGSGGGPGPTTANPPSGTHTTGNPPTSAVSTSHAPPPTSHTTSAPPVSAGPGPMTGEVSATPDAPEYITMTVSWTADPGATSYIVKYTESENPNAAPVTASDTHAQINVIPEELVCIQVQAVNSYGKSAFYPSSPYCTTG